MDAMRITKLVLSLHGKGHDERTIAKVLHHEMEHQKFMDRRAYNINMDMVINELLEHLGRQHN